MTEPFIAFASPLLNWLLFASLKSALVIGVVLLCRRAFAQRLSAQSLHRLWFAVLASLAVPIGATINVEALNRIAVWEYSPSDSAIRDLSAQPWRIAKQGTSILSSTDERGARPSKQKLSNADALALGWLAGALALVAAVAWNWARYVRIRSRARPIFDRSSQDQFDRCKKLLGVTKSVAVLESSEIDTPALFGVRSPVLLLPQDFTSQMSATELHHVFLHELTHVRRNDIALNWLAIAVQILHWFNPLVWWALRRLRVDMERACDATVLQHLSNRERLEYGHTLIHLSDLYPARLALHHGAAMLDTHSQLKTRIHMIAQFGSTKTLHSLLSNALLFVLIVASITQFSAVAQENAHAEVATTPSPAAQPVAPAKAVPATPATPAPRALPALPAQRALPAKAASPALPALPAQPALPAEPARAAEPATPASNAIARRMEIIKFRYRKAAQMAELIRPSTGASLLSEDGYLAIDERTNSIVVRDTPERLDDIRRTVVDLDVPAQQVQLDTRLVLADQSFLSSAQGKSVLASLTKDGTDATLDQALAEMVAQRKAEVITRPRLITENRKEAQIIQGIEAAQNDQRHSKLNIKITPSIAADNRITVDVSALQETTDASNKEIERRNVTTQAIVRDGGVVILRGLFSPSGPDVKQGASGSMPKEFLILMTARTLEHSVATR